jgi:hypothetical protein
MFSIACDHATKGKNEELGGYKLVDSIIEIISERMEDKRNGVDGNFSFSNFRS